MEQAGTNTPADTTRAAARVLVADDLPALRTVVRITIESQGWTTLEATNGAEAFAVARAQVPDLVLLDLDFGDDGPDGLAVLEALRSDPATAGIPVVVLTATSDPATEARARALGASLFLNKPFGPIDLIAALRRMLGADLPAAPLGLHLVQTGALTPGQLERALEEQARRDVPLGRLLLEHRAISEPELEGALSAQRDRAAVRGRRRVLIVDDHRAIRDGLRGLIGAERRFDIAVAASAAEAIEIARAERSDLIVLDHEMPDRSGLDAIADLLAAAPAARVVMYTMANVGPKALARGASAVVQKGDEALLVSTLRRLADARPDPATRVARVPTALARLHPPTWRAPRREIGGVLLSVALYTAGYFILEPALGASAAVFSIVTVGVAGALLGPEAGVLTAILTTLLTTMLWDATGHEAGEAILRVGGNGVGALMLLFLGAGLGALRVAASHTRRVEALLGHALIAHLEPDEVVRAATAILGGESAALFRLSADRSELRAVSAVGLEGLAPVIRLEALRGAAHAMREMQPVVVDDEPLPAARARSAAFVPLRFDGAGFGLLALFDKRRARFERAQPRVMLALGIAAGRSLEGAGSTERRPVPVPIGARDR